MKKRTYLLLEVLVAFMLAAICIVPLVSQPLKLYRNEVDYFETMEKERWADWTFLEIKEMLLKNEIPWEKIPSQGFYSSRFKLSPIPLHIPGIRSKTIKRSFVLRNSKQKIKPDGTLYLQVYVYVFLNKDKFTFRLPIQKSAPVSTISS